ncbi:MAG: polysaccharide deacetylase family protein [Acidobacteriia bacterium]|nr:polysaccharide deacetylase family protein [Terriglobia bacterium]
MYHDVAPDCQTKPGVIYTLAQTEFRRHLDTLKSLPFISVALCTADWGNKAPVLITFDDGGAGSPWIGEELERCGWRGHFFVVTDLIGAPGFMGRSEIRTLAERGHVIGSHSCSHPLRISALSDAALEHEWGDSVRILADVIGQPISTASVPGGFYSRRVGEAAMKAGITQLFTSTPTSAVKRLGPGTVFGRYTADRRTKMSDLVSFAGSRHSGPRRRQQLFWNIKSIAKSVSGERYERLRRVLLRLP